MKEQTQRISHAPNTAVEAGAFAQGITQSVQLAPVQQAETKGQKLAKSLGMLTEKAVQYTEQQQRELNSAAIWQANVDSKEFIRSLEGMNPQQQKAAIEQKLAGISNDTYGKSPKINQNYARAWTTNLDASYSKALGAIEVQRKEGIVVGINSEIAVLAKEKYQMNSAELNAYIKGYENLGLTKKQIGAAVVQGTLNAFNESIIDGQPDTNILNQLSVKLEDGFSYKDNADYNKLVISALSSSKGAIAKSNLNNAFSKIMTGKFTVADAANIKRGINTGIYTKEQVSDSLNTAYYSAQGQPALLPGLVAASKLTGVIIAPLKDNLKAVVSAVDGPIDNAQGEIIAKNLDTYRTLEKLGVAGDYLSQKEIGIYQRVIYGTSSEALTDKNANRGTLVAQAVNNMFVNQAGTTSTTTSTTSASFQPSSGITSKRLQQEANEATANDLNSKDTSYEYKLIYNSLDFITDPDKRSEAAKARLESKYKTISLGNPGGNWTGTGSVLSWLGITSRDLKVPVEIAAKYGNNMDRITKAIDGGLYGLQQQFGIDDIDNVDITFQRDGAGDYSGTVLIRGIDKDGNPRSIPYSMDKLMEVTVLAEERKRKATIANNTYEAKYGETQAETKARQQFDPSYFPEPVEKSLGTWNGLKKAIHDTIYSTKYTKQQLLEMSKKEQQRIFGLGR